MHDPDPTGNPPDLFDLTGRVCVVTGGSRGLGREMAHAFAARGAKVVIASRKLEACEVAAAEIVAATGADVMGAACHVGNWADCDRLVAEVLERHGRVDVLVNNAGMSPLYGSLADVSDALFDKVVGVNVRGPFRLAVLCAENMVANGRGSIINISTTSSVQPGPAEVPYAIAKAGLNALTVALAHAYAPHVRVNGIMPGPFLTDISAAWDMDRLQRDVFSRIPLQRAGDPGEIVGAALYLASDASSYTTGSMLKIDGGQAWATS